jgi:MEDS: MEthanogen/methylotroph, DcmR Sensory domain
VIDSLELGIPGVRLSAGDHVCAFYRGLKERDEILIPYLRAGLQAGDKCVCIVDATDPTAVLAVLSDEIDDVDGFLEREQLEIRRSTDAYLRSGQFSTGEMLNFWQESVSAAVVDGPFSFTRSVGEMTWALRDVPGVEELMGYESELNRFLPQYPQVILCLYDLHRFSGEVLVDILKTHPRVLLFGRVLDNPNYLEPNEFLASRK